MNFYSFHPGDYTLRTAHLEPLEDLAYRRLLDLYYLNEKPLEGTAEELARIIRMRSNAAEVGAVLAEFFEPTEAGWQHHHCDEVIAKYKAKAAQAATNGKAGGRPRKSQPLAGDNQEKTQPVIYGLQQETGSKTNQEPETNNQKEQELRAGDASASPTLSGDQAALVDHVVSKPRAARLPKDWSLPVDWRGWAISERPDLAADLDRIAETFRDYWHAKSGRDATKLDWLATWRNWIRNQKATSVVRPFPQQSRHVGLGDIDYRANLGEVNSDGSYRI